jgi:hypothetical protein
MKRILTALLAAGTLAGAVLATSAPAEALARRLGLGPRRLCGRRHRRQRGGIFVLQSLWLLWLLRAVSLSAALRLAARLERLRLGSRLYLTAGPAQVGVIS